MVRPHAFRPNPLTVADNAFQARELLAPPSTLAKRAFDEVTAVAARLEEVGVGVHLFEDVGDQLPDSVFPNNWFSTHADGRIALYPMYSPNRRDERRVDIVQALRQRFKVSVINDYSVLEDEELYLEGTGAMVLDHVNRTAYIARSFRANDRAVSQVCRDLGYTPVVFTTKDQRGTPIYHTNVMMSVGTELALIGLDTITEAAERRGVEERLNASGHQVVPLTHKQIDSFAGNAIEVQGTDGRHLVLSLTAFDSLTSEQRSIISRHAELLPVPVPTIELAGGSVRCMIAGIHLPRGGTHTSQPVDHAVTSCL